MRACTIWPPFRSMTGMISMPAVMRDMLELGNGAARLRMNVIGWDIGGVHLKAARVEDDRVVDTVQLAAPLRAGLEPLVRAFDEAKARMGRADCHAVTMTAELADTFASRGDGVERVAALAARALPGWVALYAGRAGFIPLDAAS